MSDLISRQAAIDVIAVGKDLLERVLYDLDVAGAEQKKIRVWTWLDRIVYCRFERIAIRFQKDIMENKMKHRFNIWQDVLYPFLAKLIGKRYGCCQRLRNCTRCIKRNGWKEQDDQLS